jgi:hypothetical protein
MSAEDNLSRVLFHGTHAKLNPGDIINPTERPGYGGAYAFATDNHGAAKAFATDKEGNKGNIYHVEPLDPEEISQPMPIKGFKYGNEVVSTKGFKVIKRVPHRMSSDQLNELSNK